MRRALIVLVTALCGCAGGSSGPPAGCGAVVATQSDLMVQPPNGATGVPVTVGTITVPLVSGIAGGAVALQPASGPVIAAGRLTLDAAGTTLSVTVPVLAAHTAYQVAAYTSVPPEGTSQCWATTSWNLGSFTTQ